MAKSTIQITVPELAESITEASVESWHAAVGEMVTAGQQLVSIETDKVMLEVPAPENGVLEEILKNVGESVSSGEALANFAVGGEAKVPMAKPAQAPAPAAQPVPVPTPTAAISGEIKASPATRKFALEHGIDLSTIVGSGRKDRITLEDVKAAAKSSSTAVATPAAVPTDVSSPAPAVGLVQQVSGLRTERREKMSKLRTMVATRLLQSQQQAAILTTFNEVDMSEVMQLRRQYRDEFENRYNTKLGFMPFFVKAAVAALQRYPIINAGIDGNEIVHHDYCDISIAVASPRGLVVPVLRSAETLSFANIGAQIDDFSTRAQNGSLSLDELTGGTFTITNGGVFGSMLSTPIINPPQSAILGIHATKQRPVAIDDQVVIRPMNYFALSYDHRLIDGREAVLFLIAIKKALEEPARLMLDL